MVKRTKKQLEREVDELRRVLDLLNGVADAKRHWEECAGRLMKENEQLRNGIAPTLREANLAVSVLKNLLPVEPVTHEDIRTILDTPLEEKISWWRKLFKTHV